MKIEKCFCGKSNFTLNKTIVYNGTIENGILVCSAHDDYIDEISCKDCGNCYSIDSFKEINLTTK